VYHALPDRDPLAWCREHAAAIRAVPGLRRVEFVRSTEDPSRWGTIFHFARRKDLDTYKTTGAYRSLLTSLTAAFLDTLKPVYEHVFELLDV
jgi:hypothetical protein